MKHVYMAPNVLTAHFVKDLLVDAGIFAYTGGETIGFYSGNMPVDGMGPSVWIARDEDYERAREIVESFDMGKHRLPPDAEPWQCSACSESIEPQFTACWKCGAGRPGEPDA